MFQIGPSSKVSYEDKTSDGNDDVGESFEDTYERGRFVMMMASRVKRSDWG